MSLLDTKGINSGNMRHYRLISIRNRAVNMLCLNPYEDRNVVDMLPLNDRIDVVRDAWRRAGNEECTVGALLAIGVPLGEVDGLRKLRDA